MRIIQDNSERAHKIAQELFFMVFTYSAFPHHEPLIKAKQKGGME